MHPNVSAFLRVIREGESRQDDRAYRMRFGGLGKAPVYFDDLTKHPKVFEPTHGGKKSSAAGAYQATWTTWSEFAKATGAKDFQPATQDEFALWLLNRCKAVETIKAGRFDEACRLCASTWTSLPGGAEKNAATNRARATYEKWGGQFFDPEFDPDSLATEHYGHEVTESTVRTENLYMPRTGTNVPKLSTGKTMAPLLAAILPTLISAAPDLIRAFGKGERSEQNARVAEQVATVAKEITGAVNEQEAAERIAANPQLAADFREAVAQNMDQWLGMVSRLNTMSEESKEKARAFIEKSGRTAVVGKFSFIEFLSLLMIVISSVGGGWVLYAEFPPEIKGAVVTLMLIGGWTGVKEFWLGSSMGSLSKTDLLKKD